MKHLHLEFIGASFALGLGAWLLSLGLWQLVLFVNNVRGVFLPIWLTMMLCLFTGATLMWHAREGIMAEMRQPRHRRAHAR